MEAPSWIYTSQFYLTNVNLNNKNYIFIPGFEHNWNLFQFMTNDNFYYFYLNTDYKSEYNFKIVYDIFIQKCKHIDPNNIWLILENDVSKKYLINLPTKFNFVLKDAMSSHFNGNIDEKILLFFPTYTIQEAIKIINDMSIQFDYKTENTINIIKKNISNDFYLSDNDTISFFGASVTDQKLSYVDVLSDKINNKLYKNGYQGCHINQAVWLVDDIIQIKPKICVLEWTTSVYRDTLDNIIKYLHVIVNKLLHANIIPVFLFLFKQNINNFMDIIDAYCAVAKYHNICCIHHYKIIQEIGLDNDYFLKDSCHTNYNGSVLYANILYDVIMLLKNSKNKFIPNTQLLHKQDKLNDLCTLYLDNILNNSTEYEIFNNKKYWKITDSIIINNNLNISKIVALDIIYYKHNGIININGTNIQTWDRHCYYKRSQYFNIEIDVQDSIIIHVLQDNFHTTDCKYDIIFPENKYLLISNLVYI